MAARSEGRRQVSEDDRQLPGLGQGPLGLFASGGYPLLVNVTAEHLREWLSDLRSRGNKPSTVNTRYRAAFAFFKWLIGEGERQDNPLARIEPPQVPETVQPYYTPDDVQRVFRALNGRRLKGVDATRTRTILLVLFDTGLRASELCALKTEDVHWDAQTSCVRLRAITSASSRSAPRRRRALMSYVRVRGKASPWLFSSLDRQRLATNALKLSLKRAFNAAKVEFKGIHSFRRAVRIEYNCVKGARRRTCLCSWAGGRPR